MVIKRNWNYGRKTLGLGTKRYRKHGRSTYSSLQSAKKDATKNSIIVKGNHGYYLYK